MPALLERRRCGPFPPALHVDDGFDHQLELCEQMALGSPRQHVQIIEETRRYGDSCLSFYVASIL